MNTKASVSFAMATAALLLAGCSSSDSPEPGSQGKAQQTLIKCEGVNECKGSSECKSTTNPNGCQGLNECKGQGWVTIPKEDCEKKGGKVLSEKAAAGGSNGATPGVKTASVKCEGINECKGTSDCKSATTECKGMNECKGHGYLEIPSAEECIQKGGKVQG